MKTPCFVIHQNKMDELVDGICAAVHDYYPQGIVGYSFKTNNLPWIITHMKEKGLWAEVVSSDEYTLAMKLGYSPDKVIFNGPVKGKHEFLYALSHGSVVNIDAKRELDWLGEVAGLSGKIGIRVNFDLEARCPGESQCAKEDGRFGFSYETGELDQALQRIKQAGIHLSGLHLHCSSKTRSLNVYRAIAEVAVEIVRKYHLQPDYIDIGGGFFGGVVGKPSFQEYIGLVHDVLSAESALLQTNLIVEPGMAIVGSPIDYVTTAIDVKHTPHNRFVILDGSRIHIDPLMKKQTYSYYSSKKDAMQERCICDIQTLCGFTCMENDRFFQVKNTDEYACGDKVVFEKVGAYTMGLSPLFIQFFPAVYVENQYGLNCVRQHWDAEKFI